MALKAVPRPASHPLPPAVRLLQLGNAPARSSAVRLQPGQYMVRLRYDAPVRATVERQVRGQWMPGETSTATEWWQTVTVTKPQTVRLVILGAATGHADLVRG